MPWDPGSKDYRELKEVRQKIATKQLEAFKLERSLARAKGLLHSRNKALRATGGATNTGATDTPATTGNTSPLEEHGNEDYVERVSFFLFSIIVYSVALLNCFTNLFVSK